MPERKYRIVRCDYCNRDVYSTYYELNDTIVEEYYKCPYCHTAYEYSYGSRNIELGDKATKENREMSRKEYIEAYEFMTEYEKGLMDRLYMSGINHDGHSWVTYGDVEEVVGKIILNRVRGKE